jgi:enterochelin esterase-like enzyme
LSRIARRVTPRPLKGIMDEKHENLLRKIKQLEQELLAEIHKKEERFHYVVQERKVRFTAGITALHQKLVKSIPR